MVRNAINYKDTEALIYRGFLLESYTYKNHQFLFKNLSDIEYNYIQLRFSHKPEAFRLVYYIVYSLFMVDGVNLLTLRPNCIDPLANYMFTLPETLIESFIELMASFITRMKLVSKLMEVYSYSSKSRINWYALKNQKLNQSDITGVEGTERLGLNSYQKLWMVFNTMEDTRVEIDRQSDYSRLVASAVNPKGMRNINQQEEQRRKEEKLRREDLKLGIIHPNYQKHVKSYTDLLREAYNGAHGIKDEHDLIVEQYEKSLQEQFEKTNKEMMDRTLEARDKDIINTFIQPRYWEMSPKEVEAMRLKEEAQRNTHLEMPEDEREVLMRDLNVRKIDIAPTEGTHSYSGNVVKAMDIDALYKMKNS